MPGTIQNTIDSWELPGKMGYTIDSSATVRSMTQLIYIMGTCLSQFPFGWVAFMKERKEELHDFKNPGSIGGPKNESIIRTVSYTADCSSTLTASYYAHQCYLGLIRNIGVYMFHIRPYNDLFINKMVTRWPCKKR